MNVTMSDDYVKGCAETCGQLGRATPPATRRATPPATRRAALPATPDRLLILRGGPLRVRTSGVGGRSSRQG
ncbi:hypothetical protein [Streptomyces sp. NBC_00439]|uniref:hypothetical protein n=1 Tax=Streptomyces sp. NBC_00439 TaxID=2903650 RepID=UPI002258F99C|nr:hypothetical protein [Streptomyces sp. NBC_00439]MCX5102016.1 hypothetical protein [Streptomyces sp. NBC_00439]